MQLATGRNSNRSNIIRQLAQLVSGIQREPDHDFIDEVIERQVDDLLDEFGRTNQRLTKSIDGLLDGLKLILALHVMVAASKGTVAQKQNAVELQQTISSLIKASTDKANQDQYAQELQRFSTTAEKRFVEAAGRTTDGLKYLGSLIGWRLSSAASMGIPTLFQKQSSIRLMVKIDVTTAVLRAASAPNQERINQLSKCKQDIKARVDTLSDPILVDGEHIRSLLLIFTKVLVGVNGGPNWDEISQDVSASKSDWAYLRTELIALSKTSYGSPTLGVEGKSIVDQANKLAEELKTYNDRRTDGRVNQIASEVGTLKVRASKLSAGVSLESGKVAAPILGNAAQPSTDKPQFASNAIQNLSFQLSVIGKQLQASQDIFNIVSQNQKAKSDASRNLLNRLEVLNKGTDWNILQEVLLELISMLAETVLQFQEFQESVAIASASVNAVLRKSLENLRTYGEAGPNEVKLGDVTQSEYNLRTTFNHLLNLSAVDTTLERLLGRYIEIYQLIGGAGISLAQHVLQAASFEGPGRTTSSNFDQLMWWARGSLDQIASTIEQDKRDFERDVQQLVDSLQSKGPVSLDLPLSDAVNQAKNEYVNEVTRAFSVV